jgi:phosphoribosylaminoimidazole carboxylase (NCAIR synthetase)
MTDASVHLHVYDKRRVFERRKMGHVTATGPTIGDARDRATGALAHLRWSGEDEADGRGPAS